MDSSEELTVTALWYTFISAVVNFMEDTEIKNTKR